MAMPSVPTYSGAVHLWHLYLLAGVSGAASAFFVPASESVLPHLLPASRLAQGNAIHGVVEQAALIVGALLGGLAGGWAGAAAAIGMNAVALVMAALTSLSVPRGRVGRGSGGAGRTIQEIAAGLKHAGRSQDVRTVLLIISAATLSYSGLFAVGLALLAKSFSESPVALGLLASGWGVLVIGMTLAEGLAFASLGLVGNLWAAAAILTVLGIGVAYSTDVALPTFIQTRTPRDILGRVTSVLGLPRAVLEPVSVGLLGLVLNASLQGGFFAATVPVLAAGTILALDRKARSLSTAPRAGGRGNRRHRRNLSLRFEIMTPKSTTQDFGDVIISNLNGREAFAAGGRRHRHPPRFERMEA